MNTRITLAAVALSAAATTLVPAPSLAAAEPSTPLVAEPIVIGHRGASGYRPEHTLAAYKLAIQQGADYIEPDLVSTRDGVLVARHENEISGTTDVADHPEFADRRTTKLIDGRPVTGWFTEDFTYRELKTLHAKERLPQVRPDNTAYDGEFKVPTLDQVLELAVRKGVGVYPETKHPSYFDSIGLSLEEPLVAALQAHDLDDADDEVVIQSFEVGNLKELDEVVDVDLAQLVDASGGPADLPGTTYASMVSAEGLAEVATYADGLGANKFLVLRRGTTEPTTLVDDAHAEGLVVHIWTLRRENQFMDGRFKVGTDPDAPGDMAAETRAFLDAGVDGMFADHPDVAVAARDAWLG
ncbi:glycerophosphodiester phosphodiesterase [Nocardioides gansuensis]|uniref:glycerophosphodiester phosphodiesterase n=1 Tax=Nocardioides gansuensis TaxID=2138300 RepID=A0A2T8FGB3_9ACTN|nr:glycerophosphodiester phosphodiesterase [Nocardioides gansuensis]PVG84734.1 glycerophosphodiester phosphodiesterase [Nocardioides gansuensis]